MRPVHVRPVSRPALSPRFADPAPMYAAPQASARNKPARGGNGHDADFVSF